MKGLAVAFLLTAALAGCAIPAEHRGIPQRAVFGRHAWTNERGHASVEVGAERSPDAERTAVPTRVAVGVTETATAWVDFDAWVEEDVGGTNESGVGDLVVGYRERFWEDPAVGSAAGAQFELKFPTAETPIGTREFDGYAAAMYSKRWTSAEVNLFYRLGLLGDPAADDVLFRHGLSVSAARSVGGAFDLFGEVFGEVDDSRAPAFGLVGVAVPVADALLLDLGARFGLSSDAPDVQYFGGVAVGLGRVF